MLSLRENNTKFFRTYPVDRHKSWDQAIESIPGIIRFDWETFPYLSTILKRFNSQDPYMTCPVYHAFTGRNGLWGYAKGRSLLLFACNPAAPDQIMFYPQLGHPFPNLAFEIMHNMPIPHGGYQFSRIDAKQVHFLAAAMNKKSLNFYYEVETEKLLDWSFPVHFISIESILNPTGRRFKSFRQHLNAINKRNIQIEPLDLEEDTDRIMDIIESWAYSKADICPPEEMIDVYVSFLNLMSHPGLNLQGVKFYLDGELTAFEAWAVSPEGVKTANSFAGFSKSSIRGFSEFQHQTICKILHEQGIERICLGGSENAGLDAFKRKMNPVESVELATIAVKPIAHMAETL